ncbi:MAG: chemotaxis response regulator protein-glutamate methylesterase [Polyangiaceae bacterium]
MSIRVLVVDDSVVARRLIADSLAKSPGIEVAGTAADGSIALTRIADLSPDAVVLDIEMPKMDGLQALEEIRKIKPDLPVVMFSTLTERGARATLEALDRGASDYVPKPSAVRGETLQNVVETMLAPKLIALVRSKYDAIRRLRPPGAGPMSSAHVPPSFPSSDPPSPPARSFVRSRQVIAPRAVVIAASTGGPTALAEVLPKLPADFPLPILVVQHMPPVFTRCLAERLSAQSHLKIMESEGNEIVRPGVIWIAPGGRHLEVHQEGELVLTRLSDAEPENSCRPAADVLFRSAAKVYGGALLAVVMTGMGRDGLLGTQEIVSRGGRAIVQSGPTCTVWGMPRAVEQAGVADQVVPLNELWSAINSAVRNPGFHAAGPPSSAWRA